MGIVMIFSIGMSVILMEVIVVLPTQLQSIPCFVRIVFACKTIQSQRSAITDQELVMGLAMI